MKAHELAKRLAAGPDLEVGFAAEGCFWFAREMKVEERPVVEKGEPGVAEMVVLHTFRFGEQETRNEEVGGP